MPTVDADALKKEREAMTRLANTNSDQTPAVLARRIFILDFIGGTADYQAALIVGGRTYYSIYSFLRRLKAKRDRESAKAERLLNALTSA